MQVLVDTSIWVEYFRHGRDSELLDQMIDENIIATNDLILAELIPVLKIRNQNRLISLLRAITNLPLVIDWRQIVELQYNCLKNGVNGIGIPDLIIAQNALWHDCAVYSLDSHFELIKNIVGINLVATSPSTLTT